MNYHYAMINMNLTGVVEVWGKEDCLIQLKITTDYAIRIILFLSMESGVVSSKELADKLGMTQNMVLKIGKDLNAEKLIKSTTGVDGGFQLIKDPDEIRLLDVIKITEPTIQINRCLEKDHYCSRNATDTCPVRKVYCTMQKLFEDSLKNVTFKDLLDDKNTKEKGDKV